ncbi:class F sortase [Kitasatospora nipponensis]|uniref:class F sortase n=1 Tax=Kitasatospora nipponensis TaxID=258049 RepID=UPI0031D7CE15
MSLTVGLALGATGTMGLLHHRVVPAAPTANIGTLPGTPRTAADTDPTTVKADPDTAPGTRHAPPVRLRIPRIGVDTALEDLVVADDGHLTAPVDPDRAGWWAQGPAPGSPGAAILAGHVDSRTGPAVFAGLSALHPGDGIEVDESDGATATFTVQALRSYAKDDFPNDVVYGSDASGAPGLRLITCGGTYDHQQHEYLSNLVVFAEPAAAAKEGSPQVSPADHGTLSPRTP